MEQKGIIQIVAAILIAAGIVGAGFFIGQGFYNSKMADRYVTVKGLAEKDVTADVAVWNLKLVATGNLLTEVQTKIDSDQKELMDFLAAQGITAEEQSDSQMSVIDLMAQQYRSERAEQSRFIVNYTVTVKTSDVPKIMKASQKTGELIKKNVVLADNTGPSYIFTKLNDIKPEMIAAATKNARSSAEQFALDSGSRVGGIRRASQGIFSIETRDGAVADSPESYMPGGGEQKQIDKKVRVVSTIDYFLVN